LLFRIENLDPQRCKPEFEQAAISDLRWLGLDWDGEPVRQNERRALYLEAWHQLLEKGFLYPCHRSRRDLATLAPHEEEPVFPVAWRNPPPSFKTSPGEVNWRFRVPDDRVVRFHDENLGPIERTALKDFGDFVVWNRDDIPAYELAVVVDDIAMGITEIVRGEDLLTSTARQILIYEALGATPPKTFHCPLIRDETGRRLAKRHGALALRTLRESGETAERLIERFV
jgi:glutamyl-tRNA synthetase